MWFQVLLAKILLYFREGTSDQSAKEEQQYAMSKDITKVLDSIKIDDTSQDIFQRLYLIYLKGKCY